MTANRWWVRYGARWIARVESVKGHISLVFQAMTGFGIASGVLKYYGLAWAAPYFIIIVGVVMLLFAKLYSEGGVWNQVSRDRHDLSSNFATPRDVIDDTLIATGVFAAINNREPTEAESEVIHSAVREQWAEFREGIEIEQ